MSEVLEYDLISKSYLFDNDYTSKLDKYVLVKKIEEKIVTEESLYPQRITLIYILHVINT